MENNFNGDDNPNSDNHPNAIIAKLAAYDGDTFPDWIYESLPSLVKDSCNIFNDKYEKDIFLTGLLAVFGGCFHNLYALNEPDKRQVATNLLAIIVGPPASGKGALNYARKMAKSIKEIYSTNSKKVFKSSGNRLFIPGNISSAGMIQLLAKNKGVGIMVESEIDTIVNANRQEWGNYSDIIRKSYENEEYSMYRKGKVLSEYSDIESLKLSVAISGTANQFRQLIYSTENGLFSRGTYYVFEPIAKKFKFTGRMNTDTQIDDKFAKFARIAADYYELHLSFDCIRVIFSQEQLNEVENALQALKDELDDFPELEANIKRAFVMAQKIGAILTFLFECEDGSIQETIKCSEQALDTAIYLVALYMANAHSAYELLPSKVSISLNDSQHQLLQLLPEEFTRTEAVQIGIENGIKQRTAYYAIEALEKKGLIKLQSNGKYKKQ